MFSLFPADWIQPKPKWLVKAEPTGNEIFIQKPVVPKIKLSQTSVGTNTPNVRGPNVKVSKKLNLADVCPAREMLRPEEEIDVSEIDRMLDAISWEINEDPSDANARRITEMIRTVNEHLKKNIEVLKNANPYEAENVSRDDLIKLLEMFQNYSKTLENYLKTKRYTK